MYEKSKVSLTEVGGKPWEEAMETKLDNGDTEILYTGSAARKAKLRRCFLYGMAIHQLTDTFAHSAYKKDASGKYIFLRDTKEEDDKNIGGARLEDAKAGAQRTIIAYLTKPEDAKAGQEGSIGNIINFSPKLGTEGEDRGYYLANLKKYALEANNGKDADSFSRLEKINYTID